MNRITLITLGVADLAASKAFYEALGWVASDGPPSVVFFAMGRLNFGLFGREGLAAEQGRDAAALGTGASSLSVNFADRAAVDDAFADALTAGAAPLRTPSPVEWGGYTSYWADPDGHVWEYAHNPFWALDEDGWLAPGQDP